MRKIILNITPIMLLIGIIISAIELFGNLSVDTLTITNTVGQVLTNFCVPLIVFCYVLKKDESNSLFKVGLLLILISMILTVVRNLLPLHLSSDIYSLLFKMDKTIRYIISALKYIGIFTLIETTDEKATLAKTGANLFCVIYSLLNITIVWIDAETLSVISKLSSLSYDFMELLVIAFLAQKLLSEDEADNIRKYQQAKNPELAQTTGLNYQNQVQQPAQNVQPMQNVPPVQPMPQPMPTTPPITQVPQPMPAPPVPQNPQPMQGQVQTPNQL
ncbi:MAG: hypothetical protein IKH54_03375 [Bacilli bacterium]|nr:hypothetical protein [Bacilli bacterium]